MAEPEYRQIVLDFIKPHKIPKGYCVHHLDFNHDNNSIDNLSVIPSTLHYWVHRCKFKYLSSNLLRIKEVLDNKINLNRTIKKRKRKE